MRVSPYLLLVLTTLFWSGNFVLARFTHADIPPLALSFFRWVGALLVVLPFAWGPLRRQWRLLLAHRRLILALGILGVANFNSFVYLGLQHTTATNAVLINSTLPLLILGIAWLFQRAPVTPGQWLGVLLSLLGVAVIVLNGHPAGIGGLDVNRGDFWVLAAVCSWAGYSVLLKRRPAQLDPLALLSATILVGALVVLPFWLWEHVQVRPMHWSQTGVLMVIYAAIFPSTLAYFFWNKAVAEVGAATSGQFIHLMPLFGSGLAVLLLDEQPGWPHLAGALFILGGIVLAEAKRARR